MRFKAIDKIKTAEEARQYAINWQRRNSNKKMSWHDSALYQGQFMYLAKKFHLTEEFKENCII